MKCRLLLVLATLPLVVDSYNFIEIPHTAAIQNVGKLRTVCGKVQSTYINSNTASQRIYLNMGREYPNHTFTGLIWYSSNKDNFDGRPDKKYKKKNICISGVISTLMKDLKFKLILKIKLKLGNNQRSIFSKESSWTFPSTQVAL